MNDPYVEISALAHAGAGAIQIVSHEWERVRHFIAKLAEETSLPVKVWSCPTGLGVMNTDAVVSDVQAGETDPQEVLKAHVNSDQGGILLLEDAHHFYLHSDRRHEVTRQLREACRLPLAPRRILILSGPVPGLPIEVSKEIPVVELPLPGPDDLWTVCEEVARDKGVKANRDDSLLEAARGLTVMEARLAFGLAAHELKRLDGSAVSIVSGEKKRVIRQSGILEYFEADAQMADVGGLENLKVWLDRRGKAFGHGARQWGLDAPKGLVLLGIQGCGKSLIAKSIAAAWKFPLLRFDLGRVFGGIVGQSESNIRTALQVAEALAPCVLWIDEIEKGLSGMNSSGDLDSGVSARIGGTLLTWMQEKKAPVFVVATANNIEALPPELLRKGRFDEVFFVDLPTANAREEILRIHITKKGRDAAAFELPKLASLSRGFSGAELEEAVREGMFDAFASQKELSTSHIAKAIGATYPLSRTMREAINGLREWAKARARLASSEPAEPLPDDAGTAVPVLKQERRNPFARPEGRAAT